MQCRVHVGFALRALSLSRLGLARLGTMLFILSRQMQRLGMRQALNKTAQE